VAKASYTVFIARDFIADAARRAGLLASRAKEPAEEEQEARMSAYVIASITVNDAASFEEYRAQVPATIAKHGGRYLARGGRVERLEGSWSPARLVVIEFPSLEQARRWYDSEEYRGPKALRMKCAMTDVIVVEGV
jgi:uncharacterized protein (DUF1330 family)